MSNSRPNGYLIIGAKDNGGAEPHFDITKITAFEVTSYSALEMTANQGKTMTSEEEFT